MKGAFPQDLTLSCGNLVSSDQASLWLGPSPRNCHLIYKPLSTAPC